MPSNPISSVVTPWSTAGPSLGLPEGQQPGVGVEVDEAGTDDGPGGGDGAGGGEAGGIPAQHRQAASPDADVRKKPGVARPVQDPAPANQQVKHALPQSGASRRPSP